MFTRIVNVNKIDYFLAVLYADILGSKRSGKLSYTTTITDHLLSPGQNQDFPASLSRRLPVRVVTCGKAAGPRKARVVVVIVVGYPKPLLYFSFMN